MHPIICKIGPLTIYSYGLMMVIAFLVASALARREAKRQIIDPEIIYNFGFVLFISGIIGSRLMYVITNLDYYIRYPKEIIMLQYGGLSWFGGLLLAVICGMTYLKRKKLSVYKILDLIVPFVALGQAIGRIGCLLNGCCYGRVSEFGIYFPVHKLVLVPTQVYSSLVLIIIFIALRFLQQRCLLREGGIFFSYLLLYSGKRFFIEFWRANEAMFWGLSYFQLISLATFCFALLKLIAIQKKKA